jgi:hypothetical protein
LIQINNAGSPSPTIALILGGHAVTDFGFSRPMLDRVLDQAELMDRVMEAAAVNPTRAARIDRGMAWYEARSRCIACHNDRICRSWLAATDGGQVWDTPLFCPNRAFFELAKQPTKPLEDCHDPEPAGLEATLEARRGKPLERAGA